MPSQLKADEIVIRGPREAVDAALAKLKRNAQVRVGRLVIEYTDAPPKRTGTARA